MFAINEQGGCRAIESQEDVLPGETVTDTMPVPTEADILAQAKENASIRIASYTKRMRMAIAKIYDETMMSDWPTKLRIAEAISEGTATEEQKDVFRTEILYRGRSETLGYFTGLVLLNARFYQRVAATIAGLDKKVRENINASLTSDSVGLALSEGKEEAEAAYAQLAVYKEELKAQVAKSSGA
jgi:hypothetical protein